MLARSDVNRFCWFLIELFLLTSWEKHAAAVTHARSFPTGVTMATKDFWPLSDTDELVALLSFTCLCEAL